MGKLRDLMSAAGCPPDMLPNDYLEGVDIRKEYALVMNKTSELPRVKRDMVEARYKILLEQEKVGVDKEAYYIEYQLKFDKTWQRVYSTFDAKELRKGWKKVLESEEAKKYEYRTNMSDEDLKIDDSEVVISSKQYGTILEMIKKLEGYDCAKEVGTHGMVYHYVNNVLVLSVTWVTKGGTQVFKYLSYIIDEPEPESEAPSDFAKTIMEGT